MEVLPSGAPMALGDQWFMGPLDWAIRDLDQTYLLNVLVRVSLVVVST